MNISSSHLTDLAYILRGIILWYGQHSLSSHIQLAHKNNKNKLLSISMGKRCKITQQKTNNGSQSRESDSCSTFQ